MNIRQITTTFALLLISVPAWANMPPPIDYYVHVEGNTVTICSSITARSCPQEEGMLREALGTGEITRLADYCEPTGAKCYIDECVPPGEYRYGFADPLECGSYAGSGAAYYGIAIVQDELGVCERSPDVDAPVAYDEGTPWNDEQWMECDDEAGGCMSLPGHAGALGIQSFVFMAAAVALRLRRRSNRSH